MSLIFTICGEEAWLDKESPMTTIPVYVSSKLKHRDLWIESEFTITSSWIHSPELAPDECSDMWDRYVQEVRESEGFVLYAEPNDVLKGCLLELGFAFTCRIPIVIIWQGNKADLAAKIGTIIYHKSVLVVPDIASAVAIMKQ